MGEVYRARDERLGRDVALKILPTSFAADEERRARFLREAKLAAGITHPNVATIHEADECDGQLFYAMELVRGETLQARVRPGGLPLEELLDIAIPLTEGLVAAHRQGVIHRDLKPNNVMVDEQGYLKILDFGLSRLASEDPDSSMNLTRTEQILGTPLYMSPEQVRGGVIDTRSDLFSLGTILHELGSGVRPFFGTTHGEIMDSVLNEDPAPMARANPRVDDRLQRIVSRLMEKDVERRTQTAADLRAELRGLRDTGSPRNTNRRTWIAGGLAVAVAAVFLVSWLFLEDEPGPPRIVVLPFLKGLGQGSTSGDSFAFGMQEAITERLHMASKLRVVSSFTLGDDWEKKTAAQIGQELNASHLLYGSATWNNQQESQITIVPKLVRAHDSELVWTERYNVALAKVFETQASIAKRICAALDIKLGAAELESLSFRPTDNIEAYTLYLEGRGFHVRRTTQDYDRARTYYNRAIGKDPGYRLAHNGIAGIGLFRGWYGLAAPREVYPEASASIRNAMRGDQRFPEALANLGSVLEAFEHDFAEAEVKYRSAAEPTRRFSKGYPTAHQWLAGLLSTRGQHKEALKAANTALDIDPHSPIINTSVGLRHYYAGNHREAIEAIKKALILSDDFAPAHWHLSWVYAQSGSTQKAVDEAKKALENSESSTVYIINLAWAHAMNGDQEDAVGRLAQLKQLEKTRYISSYHLAAVHVALGQYEDAFKQLHKAHEQKCAWRHYLEVDPRMSELQRDGQFQGLVQLLCH